MSAPVPSVPSISHPRFSSSPVEGGNTDMTPDVLPGLPSEEDYFHIHNIIIVTIFCAVCFLLLAAFLYAFCFQCTLQSSAKENHADTGGCSLDREDATFRRSSSSPSLGNTI